MMEKRIYYHYNMIFKLFTYFVKTSYKKKTCKAGAPIYHFLDENKTSSNFEDVFQLVTAASAA